ncbi:MAG TPA: aminopeptidase N [Actinospica sp.]|nr:aminopeptidase N [Actinospica sp.]
MSVAEITRAETRMRAELISVQRYDVELDVSHGDAVFGSSTTIRFGCRIPGSSTHADLLAEPDGIEELTLNGRRLDPAEHFADGRITLPGLVADNTLTVVAKLAYETPGFHRSTDPADGKVYTYTKFEPDHARRVFACFEQPDLKAPFAISVIAPASWTVISTQPTPEPEPTDDPALARWSFAPTPRLSTYLMHVTAGEYHVLRSSHTTARGQTRPMALACRASLAETLDSDADSLFALTGAGLDYFTALFDMDFPFAKYDQQFVPHYPAGATEHPAAVTIEDDLLYRSRATDAEYEQRAESLLHEMAHMWFGDLVTMQWWDDLWLNESFAEWAGHQSVAAVTRFTGAWTTFAGSRKSWGYAADLGPGTHPIAAEVNTVSEAMANFDGISYAKGASVLRQLIASLGEETFIRGLRSYFAEHAWGNTTLADFLRHLEAASGNSLDAWSDAWLRTTRPNTLSASFTEAADGTFAAFAVVQEAQPGHPTLRPHHIAIGLYRRAAGRLTRAHRVEVDVAGPLTEVPELIGQLRPDLVLLNDGDLGYALIRFDEQSWRTLLEAIGEFDDSLARAICTTSAAMLAEQGELPLPGYVRLTAAAMEAEPSVAIVQSLRRTARNALLFMAEPRWAQRGREILADAALRMIDAAQPGGDRQLAAVQLLGDNAVAEPQLALVRGLYQGTVELPGLAVTRELRWSLLARLAFAGLAGDAEIDAELARDRSDLGERAALAARASIQDSAHKEAAWALLTGKEHPPPMTIIDVGLAFRQAADPELLTPFRDRYFAVLRELWDNRLSFAKEGSVMVLLPTAEVDQALLDRIDAFLEQNKDADAALVRAVLDARDTAARAAASRALGAAQPTQTP